MTILIFLAVLLLLIVVHELGHFIVAKKSGIRVDEFGIGFPPKVFGKKYGETEYSINALPFGGFVRIFGENPDQDSLTGPDSARAMLHQPRTIQALVLVAGVSFNILFAWLLFSSTFALGTQSVKGEYDAQYFSSEGVVFVQILPGSPAEKAGLLAGDKVTNLSVDGDTLSLAQAEDFSVFLSAHEGELLTLSIARDGVAQEISLTPETNLLAENRSAPAIGVALAEIGTVQFPVYLALWEGAKRSVVLFKDITVGITKFVYDALLLRADFSSVAGPVGIVKLVGDASTLGLITLINFTAFISLNLAVINLIPFPALDGGRLLFLGIEAVKGSPIRPAIANAFNTVGFALLILLMLAVTYSDIVRLVT
jgi:regulator of sigma E protease